MFFSSSQVWMWELDHKEGWEPKNWCFQVVVLEKTLESPLDCKEIKQSMLKEIKSELSWLEFNGIEFTGRTDAEAPVLWPPDVNSWLIGKDSNVGKDWGQEEKWATEDEVVGWHHQLNGHELSKLRELVMDRKSWHAAVHGVTKSPRELSNWATVTLCHCDGDTQAYVYMQKMASSDFGTTHLALNSQASDLFELLFPYRGVAII